MSQPLDSTLYPTKYPLSLSSSIRNNVGEDGSGDLSGIPYGLTGSPHMYPQASSSNYEAPKFRTFQERKREKERQLALAAGREWSDSSETIPPREPTRQPQPLRHDSYSTIETHVSASPSSSRSPTPSWPGRDPSLILPGIGVPLAPSNILPSERRTDSAGASRRPLPLPSKHADAPANGLPLNAQVHGMNRSQTVQRPLPSTGLGGMTPTSSLQSFPSISTRADSPSVPGGSRRLPKPKSMANIVTSSAQRRPMPMSESSDPVVSARTIDPSLSCGPAVDHGPSWQRDRFARSDTVTSVKSLDRFGLSQSSERPLPAPPVVIGSSRSLDRGPKVISPMQAPPGDFQAARQAERPWSPAQPPSERSDASTAQSKACGSSGASPIVISIPTVIGPSDVDSRYRPSDQADIPARAPSPLPSYAYSSIPRISVATIAADEAQVAPPAIPSIVLPGDSGLEDDLTSITINVPTVPTLVMPDEEQPATQSDVRPIQRSGTGIFCARCDTAIIGRIVSAMDKRWHPQCFQCSTCHTLLEHVSSYEHEGKAYCHMDYHDLFAPKCHYCETAIVDSRFITIDDPALGNRYYHELHFFCAECGDPFLDPSKSSAAGTEFSKGTGAEQESDDLTKEFVINGKHAFCVECDVKLHRPKCAGCRKPIRAEAVGAMGAKWHKDCFCCAQCDESFPNGNFFPIDGEPFCQDCYSASLQNGR